MRKCTCGCDRFFAHQVQYHDVIVRVFDSYAFFEDELPNSCYETENPYGPFTCENCGKEYANLDDIPNVEDNAS